MDQNNEKYHSKFEVKNWSFPWVFSSDCLEALLLHPQSPANTEMQLLTGVKNPATMVTMATAIIFIASMPLAWSKEQLSSRECEDLGFTGLALCSDCHTLAEYIKDQGDAFDSLDFYFLFFLYAFLIRLWIYIFVITFLPFSWLFLVNSQHINDFVRLFSWSSAFFWMIDCSSCVGFDYGSFFAWFRLGISGLLCCSLDVLPLALISIFEFLSIVDRVC